MSALILALSAIRDEEQPLIIPLAGGLVSVTSQYPTNVGRCVPARPAFLFDNPRAQNSLKNAISADNAAFRVYRPGIATTRVKLALDSANLTEYLDYNLVAEALDGKSFFVPVYGGIIEMTNSRDAGAAHISVAWEGILSDGRAFCEMASPPNATQAEYQDVVPVYASATGVPQCRQRPSFQISPDGDTLAGGAAFSVFNGSGEKEGPFADYAMVMGRAVNTAGTRTALSELEFVVDITTTHANQGFAFGFASPLFPATMLKWALLSAAGEVRTRQALGIGPKDSILGAAVDVTDCDVLEACRHIFDLPDDWVPAQGWKGVIEKMIPVKG